MEIEIEKLMISIGQHIEGNWISERLVEDKRETIKLAIRRGICNLFKSVDGKQIESMEFYGSAHWFGHWLCFTSAPQQFYVKFADTDSMIFGEYQGNMIGQNIVWEHRFNRVSNLI